jgi:signal transduction histidine kinase
MAMFAILAFISVAIVHKQGAFSENWEDSCQVVRYGIFAMASIFVIWAIRYESFAIARYRLITIAVWLLLTIGLTLLVIAQVRLSLVVYMLGTMGPAMVFILLMPATISVLFYNFTFLSLVEAQSSATYFVIANVIGIAFAQFKRNGDVELFLKTRDLNHVLKTVHESEAREKDISAAKTRLIASVSYDLRQPLNSLALYNKLLKSKFGGDKNVVLNSIAERVQECVSAMEGNLTRLQDTAQLQARIHTVDLASGKPAHDSKCI